MDDEITIAHRAGQTNQIQIFAAPERVVILPGTFETALLVGGKVIPLTILTPSKINLSTGLEPTFSCAGDKNLVHAKVGSVRELDGRR